MLPNLSGLALRATPVPVGAPGDGAEPLEAVPEFRRHAAVPDPVASFFAHAQVNMERTLVENDNTNEYNTLTPVAAFDIVYPDDWALLTAYRQTLQKEMPPCKRYGDYKECVLTDKDLAALAADSPLGPLNADQNEKYLVHGTSFERIKVIMQDRFRRSSFEGPGKWSSNAYGNAFYFAEDAGKSDPHANPKAEPQALYDLCGQSAPDPELKCMLIARVRLGCANHLMNSFTLDEKGEAVAKPPEVIPYGSNHSLDLHGEGSYRFPVPRHGFANGHDSIIVEHDRVPRGPHGPLSREFLVRDESAILPVMMVVYKRETLPTPPSSVPKPLACGPYDAFASLLGMLTAYEPGRQASKGGHYRDDDKEFAEVFEWLSGALQQYEPGDFEDKRNEVVAALKAFLARDEWKQPIQPSMKSEVDKVRNFTEQLLRRWEDNSDSNEDATEGRRVAPRTS